MKKFRIYIDTSILGGCEDEEFSVASLKLVDCIRRGRFKVLVSDLLVRELSLAPEGIKGVLQSSNRHTFAIGGDLNHEKKEIRLCCI